MVKTRTKQRTTCPDGWLKAGVKVPVSLTVKQEWYATRAVGIARAVFNLMVATHQSARAQVHGLWPSPMELEKQFNDLKHQPEFGMQYATEVSKFVAQGASRDFRGRIRTGAIPNCGPPSPASGRRAVSAPGLSWPPPAWTASDTMATAVSGCPIWVR